MISSGGQTALTRRLTAVAAALALLACAGVEPSISQSEIEQDLEQGRGALARGEPGKARALFGQALAGATQRGDTDLETDARIAIAESERELGDLGAALAQLEAARQQAGKSASDPARLAAVEIALGSTELAAGRPGPARAWLEAGAQRAKETGQPRLEAAGLLDLGTLLALQGEAERAADTYQRSARSAEAAGGTLAAAQALANAARVEAGDPARAGQFLVRSVALARSLPASHAKANLLISLGEQRLAGGTVADGPGADALLTEALAAAREVGDVRAASYAQGFLGTFYEKTGHPAQALAATDQAIVLAAHADATESVYRWQAQRGRLLAAQGRAAEAIRAYQRAVERSRSLRHREAWGGSLRPSSFQSDAAPIYYALIDLLLRQAERAGGAALSDDAEQALLRQARDTAEQLRAAELRDYFQDDCVDALRAKLAGLESVSPSALVIYPIPLPDRLVVLVGLPSGMLEQYAAPVGRAQVEQEARSLRRQLGNRATRRYRVHARNLYDWLIRPMQARLEAGGVDTLVFVPDSALVSIPMATLYDGNQFLVERFALGLTPGLQLTDPQPMNPERVRALIGGVSQGIDGFSPLPNVVPEVRAVSKLTGGEVMLDEAFRREALRDALAEEPFSLVHLATHAEFSGSGEGGFLLAWDGRISLDELASDIGLFRFRDEPLELLTLSACDTAQGDDRAALGLSGIAIKAGARSALGTLWSINDPAAESLVSAFYQALLVDGVSRAEALRRAQRGLLAQDAYRHPVYWAPFILIGSWL